ncbi:MAG: J domain-containing protein [Methylococcales bacterium]
MINPFALLQVSESANDEEVRSAYLARVREFPPERSPKQFQAIREAYERIKTEKARLTYVYFDSPEIGPETVCRNLMDSRSPKRPDEFQFKKMLSDSLRSMGSDPLKVK